jgi:hypothetical protein
METVTMPVAYEFDNRVIVLRMAGKYAANDLRKAILDALDDSRAPKGPVLLFDLRESTSLGDRTADEVREMARFLAAHGKRFSNRLAMVTGDDLAFGLMRLGSATAVSGGVDAEVFRDMDAARRWLQQ